jgi:hypothetical protein
MGEKERTIATALDKAISRSRFKNKIMNNQTDSKLRLCIQHEETTGHLTTMWSISAKNEYSMRHYTVGAHLYYSIRKTQDKETTQKWHIHTHTITHSSQYVKMNM